ncbi:Protein C34F6.11 [Aphelenchoides avenae]|nr:Protein C34F6.11 [Aphelenchus avenae]
MQCVRFLDECFTTFSLWLDCKINEHNLLDVPDGKPWKIFQVGVYGHIVFTSILVVVGISCFCTGIENSFMYTEVNCTDGVSLTAPLVNIVAAFVGLVALKQPESSWAAFVHFVVSVTIFLMNVYFTCDQILMSKRWFAVRARTDENWPIHFAWIDLSVVVTLLLVAGPARMEKKCVRIAHNFTGSKRVAFETCSISP